MYKFTLISSSNNDTMSVGCKLAGYLNNSDTVILTGELGAGKTKFVEGFLSYFNLSDEISSPTFNIVNEYNHDNINIYHFDVYRLKNVTEFFEIGGEEYFSKGICLIEWGETIFSALPKDYIKITFEKDLEYENKRLLHFELLGKYENLKEIFNENIKY